MSSALSTNDDFVFTNSEMSSAECSNQHHIKYELRLRSRAYRKMRHLNVGGMVHTGVELLYRAAQNPDLSFEEMTSPDMLEKIQSHVRQLAKKEMAKFIPDPHANPAVYQRQLKKDRGMIKVAIDGFFKHIFAKEQYEIIEPEMQFIVPVRTPSGRKSPKFKFAGKVDGVVRNVMGDNLMYLHELKVLGKFDDNDIRYLAIDDQITGYLWAAREMGMHLNGVVYTVIRKSGFDFSLNKDGKKRMKDAKAENRKYVYDPIDDYETADELIARIAKDYDENPSKYFIRKIIARTQAQIDAFGKRLYLKVTDIVRMQSLPAYPQPSPFQCSMCNVFELCANFTEENAKTNYEPHSKKHGELDYQKDFVSEVDRVKHAG